MTYQLIYSSLSAIPMQREELQAPHKRARSANRAKGITGALVYVDGCFLQVLEGEIGPVRDLMERTSRDVRHEEVTILQVAEIADPVFPQWDMAYVSAKPEQVAEWVGFSAQAPLRELLEDMRQDRQRSERVTRRILAALFRKPGPGSHDRQGLLRVLVPRRSTATRRIRQKQFNKKLSIQEVQPCQLRVRFRQRPPSLRLCSCI